MIDYKALGRRLTLEPQKLMMEDEKFFLVINHKKMQVRFSRKGFQGFSRIAQTSTHESLRKLAKSGKPLGFKVVGDAWSRWNFRGPEQWPNIVKIVNGVLAMHPELVYHVDANSSPPTIVGITKTWCHSVDPTTLFGNVTFPVVDTFSLSDDEAYTLMTLATYPHGTASMFLKFGLSGIADASFGVRILLNLEDQKGKGFRVEKWIAIVENKHLGRIVDFETSCHRWIDRRAEIQERMWALDHNQIHDIILNNDKRVDQRLAIDTLLTDHFQFGD